MSGKALGKAFGADDWRRLRPWGQGGEGKRGVAAVRSGFVFIAGKEKRGAVSAPLFFLP